MTAPHVTQTVDNPQVAQVLERLVAGVSLALRDSLIGIYLYGSLVTEDFDAQVSDLDLVVILNQGLDDAGFRALHNLHQQVIRRFPEWDDRLELAYISLGALKTFRERNSRIAIISPGEPFHQVDAGHDWLISWYMLRETSVALYGPDIVSLIEPIEPAHYIDAVRTHIEAYRDSAMSAESKSFLSYIVLTTARGLYTVLHNQPTSKIKSAAWAAQSFPQWATLIDQALRWRVDPGTDALMPDDIRPRVQAFVDDMLTYLSR